LGWAGGREGGKGGEGKSSSRGVHAAFLKGTVPVVMEDMVISGIGLLAGVFGLVGLGLVWLGIVKYRGVSYHICSWGSLSPARPQSPDSKTKVLGIPCCFPITV